MKKTFVLLVFLIIPIFMGEAAAQTAGSDSVAAAQVDSVEEAKKHLSFGRQYEEVKMYDEAIRQYEKSINFDPSNALTHYLLGNLYYIKLEQPEKAKEAYKAAIGVDPFHSYSHYMLGRIYYQESKYDAAIVELEEAIKFNSDIEEQACLALGDLCAFRGDDSALKYYLGAINLIYNDVRRFWTFAKLLDKNGYYEEAISAYRHVIELDPNHREALLRLAETQLKVQAYRGALDSYSKLAELDPENAHYHIVMAQIYEQTEDTDGVLACLYNVVDIAPDNTDAIAKTAEICIDQNDLERAKRDIDRGLKIDSKDARFRVLNGEYYRAKGQDELAINELKRALSDPEWKDYAQGLIWEIKPPLSEEEKLKKEFFERGREKKK